MGAIIGGILWIILCALTATLAERKGHKGIGYFLLALFLSPLIGLIIVACISNKTQKLCPYCKKQLIYMQLFVVSVEKNLPKRILLMLKKKNGFLKGL